ncbi:hypothetical protein [Marinimicrobium sp. ABcell2]|uniref:hypothetical protein n=1 Tax=Marinimicrobium sp. ABcell2 TaxID=3069751 RepID=UPI0027B7C289|nr:hypothetical protein [Marinimicrobium sp. ABcell2]MDQ2076154.1 hypothetical protein [Marinimicrobium sp. ABcell2]
MNPKPLLKHFPELAHLPQEEQESLLRRADEDATGPEHRLETWRSNLLSLAVVTGLSLALIFWLGPVLNLSRQSTAIFIMVVVLPGFIVIQQRRYIARLKPFVAQRLKHREIAGNKE